jgi:amino acid transporter
VSLFVLVKRLLIGPPIDSQHDMAEKLNVPIGLAVFSADALSSTAYATDEILLALAGSIYAAQTNLISLPVALAIALLIGIVVISYRQVIRAYPQGGGAYIVAKENLGILPSHIAAASLLIDYILTVSVSITAGVSAITSTGLIPSRLTVLLSVALVLFILFINLRGIRQSGATFAFPAYTFLLSMAILIATGLWKTMHGMAPLSLVISHPHAASSLTQQGALWLNISFILVFLKAFSHGCAGLTGIEAVSNGVKAFKDPAPDKAGKTMLLMGSLLAIIFLGITFLSFAFHILPKSNETIISQVAGGIFGHNTFLYYLVQFSTMVMLILAANTSFADFPRVSNLLATDGYLPRQLMSLGDRLVFSNGMMVLGLLSIGLIILFHGDTHALIPLYAVGVFVSFTCSQSGMVIHHLRYRQPGWRTGVMINGFGACMTAIVTVILMLEKFKEGAWIILIAIPALVQLFRVIHRGYQSLSRDLALPESSACPQGRAHPALVLVTMFNQATLPALNYAMSISNQIEAVHVKLDTERTEQVKTQWDKLACGIKLTILESPFRSTLQPTLDYITTLEEQNGNELISIIIPEIVSKHWWRNFLYNQPPTLIELLRRRHGKVVTTVRYFMD